MLYDLANQHAAGLYGTFFTYLILLGFYGAAKLFVKRLASGTKQKRGTANKACDLNIWFFGNYQSCTQPRSPRGIEGISPNGEQPGPYLGNGLPRCEYLSLHAIKRD